MAGNQETNKRGVHDNRKGFGDWNLDNRVHRFRDCCNNDFNENKIKKTKQSIEKIHIKKIKKRDKNKNFKTPIRIRAKQILKNKSS